MDPTQLADCYTKMMRPYDLQDPIKTLFTQIDDGVRYALAGGAALRRMLIPQVRLAHKYPISPWEMIHPPGGDNPVRI
jgi:hypothetical protein